MLLVTVNNKSLTITINHINNYYCITLILSNVRTGDPPLDRWLEVALLGRFSGLSDLTASLLR